MAAAGWRDIGVAREGSRVRGMVEIVVGAGFGFVLASLRYDFLTDALWVAGVHVSPPMDHASLLGLGVILLILTGVLLLLFVGIARWVARTAVLSPMPP